eukprot:c24181_g1_i1 orf=61-1653(+)
MQNCVCVFGGYSGLLLLLLVSISTNSHTMSSVYVLEPPTKGKVVLNTTAGPLDIELWPKEAPKAVRNFVQLCLEGYYDDTAFHRIIKSFMVQGGDATGTGRGGESIYGFPFADEFHSRLRFNHRGLVANANAGSPNSNNSQFFISLDRCDWLDRKHTIFGKVTGNTVYNLIRLGEVEVDKDDRPLEPVPKILSTEVLWNPFDDIVPRKLHGSVDETSAEEGKDYRKKIEEESSKKKTVKQLNLLSFGDEAEEEQKELGKLNVKIKSSHDVLEDPRLLRAVPESAELDPVELKRQKELQILVRDALTSRKRDGDEHELDQSGSDTEKEIDFDARMRRQILERRKKLGDNVLDGRHEKAMDRNKGAMALRADDRAEEDNGVARRDKLLLKKKGLGSEARGDLAFKADVDAQLLSPLEQQRQMHKQRKRTRQGREEATLAKLEKFRMVLTKEKETQQRKIEAVNLETDDDSGWMTHHLAFSPEAAKKDEMARNDDPNQYVVHDPLLEKGKEKFNKMQAKMKRKDREWAGKSLT